jgi:hypothetical protein
LPASRTSLRRGGRRSLIFGTNAALERGTSHEREATVTGDGGIAGPWLKPCFGSDLFHRRRWVPAQAPEGPAKDSLSQQDEQKSGWLQRHPDPLSLE